MRMSRLGAFLALLLTAWAIPAMANRAAVATAEAHATAAAEEVLRAGGNAVDAAVAAGFALAVTYPEAGNLGGGGLATVWFEGKAYFLDYRERAPHRATANMYLDAKGDPIPNASTIGARAAGSLSGACGTPRASDSSAYCWATLTLVPTLAVGGDEAAAGEARAGVTYPTPPSPISDCW
jgi:gamma-glutamyltranspeptidase/glutathione hydrolase